MMHRPIACILFGQYTPINEARDRDRLRIGIQEGHNVTRQRLLPSLRPQTRHISADGLYRPLRSITGHRDSFPRYHARNRLLETGVAECKRLQPRGHAPLRHRKPVSDESRKDRTSCQHDHPVVTSISNNADETRATLLHRHARRLQRPSTSLRCAVQRCTARLPTKQFQSFDRKPTMWRSSLSLLEATYADCNDRVGYYAERYDVRTSARRSRASATNTGLARVASTAGTVAC